MRLEALREKVRIWDQQELSPGDTARFATLLELLDYHAVGEWHRYLPAEQSRFSPSYMERLADWLGNFADDADQKVLLEYATYVSFFSDGDFAALYRTAFNRELLPWVASQVGLTLRQGLSLFRDDLAHHVNRTTWICSVTDSMKINEFYKVNLLEGSQFHPALAPFEFLAIKNPNQSRILIDHMQSQTPMLERLVLLEDFVGTGKQSLNVLRWAVKELGVPILFIPLIACPIGAAVLAAEAAKSGGRLSVRPVTTLARTEILGPERRGEEGFPSAREIEDIVRASYPKIKGEFPAFGFQNSGCSIALVTNTPDNTLPMIHHAPQDDSWRALFPRVPRGQE